MKKFFLTILILVLEVPLIVSASEYSDITDDIEIRYKWYKEIITGGDYYPYKEITKNDQIDKNNIKYGPYSLWSEEYCELSEEFYNIDKKTLIIYHKLNDVRYVRIDNIQYNNNVKIYGKNKLIDFKIISNEQNILKIDLKINYMCDDLLFYIEDCHNYQISLYSNNGFTDYIISKTVENEIITSPDKSWITDKTKFINYVVGIEYQNDELITQTDKHEVCRYREKYVYKYNIEKEYYDDNYHLNVDNYIKDKNDYKFFYKIEPIVNTIEIIQEKKVKEKEIEYVYIEVENDIKENDSSNENNCKKEIQTEIKTEIVEKEIFKIPKKIYIIIVLLIVVIIYLIVKVYKKYVVRKI